jgi:hypothetical protein
MYWILSYLSFLLMYGDSVSCICHDCGEHWRSLIMDHNTLNCYYLPCCAMVDHSFPLDKCCHSWVELYY